MMKPVNWIPQLSSSSPLGQSGLLSQCNVLSRHKTADVPFKYESPQGNCSWGQTVSVINIPLMMLICIDDHFVIIHSLIFEFLFN